MFRENSDDQVTVSWPSHGITESEAMAKCNDTIVNKTVIGDSCFDNNSGGGTSSDDIIQACVNDVQVLPVFLCGSLSDYPAEVGVLFTTVSSIRVSRVRVTLTVTVRVSRVSVMVSVRDSVKYVPL